MGSTVYETATDDDTWMDSDPDNGHSSFSSGSNSPAPPRPSAERRSARNVVPPPRFTYDKIGTPAIKYQTRKR